MEGEIELQPQLLLNLKSHIEMYWQQLCKICMY